MALPLLGGSGPGRENAVLFVVELMPGALPPAPDPSEHAWKPTTRSQGSQKDEPWGDN